MCLQALGLLPSPPTTPSFPRSNSAPTKSTAQFSSRDRARQCFLSSTPTSRLPPRGGRLKSFENALHAITSLNERSSRALRGRARLLDEYRQALTKLIEKSTEIDQLPPYGRFRGSIVKGRRDEDRPAFRSQRL